MALAGRRWGGSVSWINLPDVEAQLRAAGLRYKAIGGDDIGQFRRCAVEGEGRDLRGWYKLIEIRIDSGDLALIGSFGVYRGADPGSQKLTLTVAEGQALSAEQRKAAAAQAREARAEAKRRRQAEGDEAAQTAQAAWRELATEGASAYLARKGVGAHGVRFDADGELVVPMHDVRGQIRGLQRIFDPTRQADRIKRLGRDRTYWPTGVLKDAVFCLIGPAPTGVLLICEGYATGATLHEASGLPVAVAFDAGSLDGVARALAKHYPRARIVLCADDDWTARCPACGKRAVVADPACRHCGADVAGKLTNVGVSRAADAAAWVSGSVLVPQFAPGAERGDKISDFNDLQQIEGRHVVRAQVEAHLSALGLSVGGAQTPPGNTPGELGDGGQFPVDSLLRHYALIYSTETVFDGERTIVLGLGALRSAAGKSRIREWLEHPRRRLVMPDQVGFDPAGTDAHITCNLWRGWPTTPKPGNCQLLLELLAYLCGNEPDPDGTYQWLLKWAAYPLQNHGAKMSTAVLMHGPEGSGKNMFWGSLAAIYATYAASISQTELESQFNGWASAKLFVIGNEVVQRAELYHQQGRLKTMITEPSWMVNEKNLPTRQEANHANFVFLSNRLDIAKLDRNDRRYAVVWTPEGMGGDFYQQLREDIDAGAVAALHDYLLRLPLGDFGPHTRPPMTAAKAELIDLSLDSPERFWQDWVHQRLAVPCRPAIAEQLYALYRLWCGDKGIKHPAAEHILLAAVGKQPGVLRRIDRFANPSRLGYLKRRIVYPPGQHQPPAGVTLSAWLSGCVEATNQALEDYRAGVLVSDPDEQEAVA